MRTKAAPKELGAPDPKDQPISEDPSVQVVELAFRSTIDKELKRGKRDAPIPVELPDVFCSDDCPVRQNIIDDYRTRGGWTVAEIHNDFVHCLMFS